MQNPTTTEGPIHADSFAEIVELIDAAGGLNPSLRIVTPAGVTVTPAHRMAIGTDAEAIQLTADGRGAITEGWCTSDWCEGSDDEPYVERWDRRGRVFHGYVCGRCRHLVQVG